MKVRKRKTKETNRPIFSKKSINEPNELNTSAVEIPMYAPNMGLAPKDYQLSPKLTELEETFEGICKAFLKAANPDMFNSSYMDAIIERTIVEALKFIRVQRCDHERLITENLMAMPGLIPIFHEFKASFPFVFEVEKPNPPSANNRTTSLFKKK